MKLQADDGTPFVLDGSLLTDLRAPVRKIEWSPGGIPPRPSLFAQWFPDTTRYASLSELSEVPHSPAAVKDQFVYVGQGGYFYSPFRSSNFQSLMKYFVQYLEGSLLDWQLGDLMPSCTAGDIRISYKVQDPEDISIVAQVSNNNLSDGRLRLEPVQTLKRGEPLKLVHAGELTIYEIIEAEARNSRLSTYLPRIML